MKKILWIGSYLVPSGFSKVNRSIIKHLSSKYEITVIDYDKVFKDGVQNFEDIKITGCIGQSDLYAFKKIQQTDFSAFDIIFILNDPWGLDQFLHVLKQRGSKAKVVCYFPVDATGHDKQWYNHFDIVDVPVTYTQFGFNEVMRVAPEVKDRLQIIPHGIDTDIFYKLPETKAQLREKHFRTDKYNDSVIFLNANRNQTRKRLDITMKAFAMFLKNTPDAFLYMHCGNTDLKSMNISRLAERYGIESQLMMTGQPGSTLQKVSNEMVNIIYNMCDFGLNSSMGEGWGLTNTEHAATGAPQIVPNHSACAELFSGVATLVDIACDYTLDEIMTIGKLVDSTKMAYAIYNHYTMLKKNTQEARVLSEFSIARFTSSKYLWKNIAEQWDAVFSSL